MTRPAPRRAGAALLVFLLGGCAHPRGRLGPDGEPLWSELRTAHLTVCSDAEPAALRAAALRLEGLRAALLAPAWAQGGAGVPRLRVLLLADPGAAGARAGAAGGTDLLREPFLAAGLEQALRGEPPLLHELSHALHRGLLQRAPRWLSEGLASWSETLALSDDGRSAELGGPAEPWFRLARAQADLQLPLVLRLGPEVHSRPPEELARFRAVSWLLTQFLLEEQAKETEELLGRLARAEDPARAFAAAFPGLTADELARRLRAWIDQGRARPARFAVPAAEAALEPATALSPARALAARAQALAALEPAQAGAAARALAERARALAPADPEVLAAWAGLSAPPPDDATAAARAAARGPKDARAWALLAALLEGKAGAAERAKAAEKATALAPQEPGPWTSLAEAALALGEPKRALASAEKAARLAPWDPAAADALSGALAATGRCADSAVALQRALELLPDAVTEARVERLRALADERAQGCKARSLAQAAPALPAAPVLSRAVAPPRRVRCKQAGPALRPGQRLADGKVLFVRYRVRADGRMEEFRGNPQDPPEALKAIRTFLQGCRFELAPGAAAPAEVEESFTFGGQP